LRRQQARRHTHAPEMHVMQYAKHTRASGRHGIKHAYRHVGIQTDTHARTHTLSASISAVALAVSSCPMAGVRCVTVTACAAIHTANAPGLPMSAGSGMWMQAPKKMGVNTSR